MNSCKSYILIKKISCCTVICASFLMSACTYQDVDKISNNGDDIAIITDKEYSKTMVDVYADHDEKLYLPNPGDVSDVKDSVKLRFCEDVDEKYDVLSSRDSWLASCKCNIPFIEDNEECFVLKYAFGNCTGITDYRFNVQTHMKNNALEKYPELYDDKTSYNANCLVLLVVKHLTLQGEEQDEREGIYLLILDYENHKVYEKKVDIVSEYADIYMADLTEDGLDDIVVVSDLSNRENGDVEVYSFIDNDFDCIYCPGQDSADTNYYNSLNARFVDDYKITLEYSGIDFKQTVSLLSLPHFTKKYGSDFLRTFTTNDLESDKKKPGEAKWKKRRRLWKKGKLISGKENSQLKITLPEDNQLARVDCNINRLSYEQWLHWGGKHDSDILCRIHTTLKYNQKTQKLEICSIETRWNDALEYADLVDEMYYLPFSPHVPCEN